jgi:hypothetical protein
VAVTEEKYKSDVVNLGSLCMLCSWLVFYLKKCGGSAKCQVIDIQDNVIVFLFALIFSRFSWRQWLIQ